MVALITSEIAHVFRVTEWTFYVSDTEYFLAGMVFDRQFVYRKKKINVSGLKR